ncbi:MAG: hypothetical protein IH597_08815 [Bacteroidales bacterium]|nr:hypothetical protein [Bacteroidales bacterium]
MCEKKFISGSGQSVRDSILKLSVNDYKEVLDFYIEKISKKTSIRSIYQAGRCNTSGFSDIDLIIVTGEDFSISHHRRIMDASDARVKYLFVHNPVFCTELLFKKLQYWYTVSEIKHLYGESLEIDYLSETNPNHILKINNWFITKIPRCFWRSKLADVGDVRTMLNHMYSFRHTVNLIKPFLGMSYDKWDDMIDVVSKMRNDWFELGPTKYSCLIQCLSEVIALSYEMMEKWAEFIQSYFNIQYMKEKYGEIIYGGYNTNIVFSSDWAIPEAVRYTPEEYRKFSSLVINLPSVMAFPLMNYSKKEPSLIGKYIKKKLFVNRIEFIASHDNDMFFNHLEILDDYLNYQGQIGNPYAEIIYTLGAKAT